MSMLLCNKIKIKNKKFTFERYFLLENTTRYLLTAIGLLYGEKCK